MDHAIHLVAIHLVRGGGLSQGTWKLATGVHRGCFIGARLAKYGSGCWMRACVRVEGSHHLSDRETVPEVVEWVITIVLLYLQLCMVCVCVWWGEGD